MGRILQCLGLSDNSRLYSQYQYIKVRPKWMPFDHCLPVCTVTVSAIQWMLVSSIHDDTINRVWHRVQFRVDNEETLRLHRSRPHRVIIVIAIEDTPWQIRDHSYFKDNALNPKESILLMYTANSHDQRFFLSD